MRLDIEALARDIEAHEVRERRRHKGQEDGQVEALADAFVDRLLGGERRQALDLGFGGGF